MMEAIIKNIVGDMIANMENECVKICQSYGFDVDKERLTQALTDARKFYDEGYRDGKVAAMAEIVRCWECKHRESRDCPMCHEEYYYDEDDGGDLYIIDKAVDPNGFCSAGERRADDDQA